MTDKTETLPYRPCVGAMILNTQNEVFVGQRIDNPTPAWQMPQGGIDPGEDAQTAVLREAQEETGIDPSLLQVVAQSSDVIPYDLPANLIPKLWGGKYRGQEQRWFLLRFTGSDADINIETDHQEFSKWQWMDQGDLVDNIVPFKREVYAKVLAEFEVHL